MNVLERYAELIAGAKRGLEHAKDVGHEPAEVQRRAARLSALEVELKHVRELTVRAKRYEWLRTRLDPADVRELEFDYPTGTASPDFANSGRAIDKRIDAAIAKAEGRP